MMLKASVRPAHGQRGGWLARLSLLLSVSASATLIGCGMYTSDEDALHLNSPKDRHPIGFQSTRAQLDVELPPASAPFSPNQQADLMGFINGYRGEGTGPLRIIAPGTGRAAGAVRQIREMAAGAGVPQQSIRVERSSAGDGALRLAYPRREVVPPSCTDWSEDLGRDHARVHYPNFGCATQRNLALNVANPRDLVEPQPEQPGSSERRYVNWTKYVGTPSAPAASPTDTGKLAPAKGSNANSASKQ